jgi:phage baseplate assembly protein W
MATKFDVLGTPLTDIEIGATGLREIAQNVKTIITTWRGTLFLDRMFGIDPTIIDKPINEVMAELIMDLTQQINRYEPRAAVVSISFEPSNAGTGEVIPLVRIELKEGVLI